jgi:hypothetical protein
MAGRERQRAVSSVCGSCLRGLDSRDSSPPFEELGRMYDYDIDSAFQDSRADRSQTRGHVITWSRDTRRAQGPAGAEGQGALTSTRAEQILQTSEHVSNTVTQTVTETLGLTCDT